ncbi:hypothetical protein COCOBI_15-0950 [Coccomyxa sp. Obi]|nr:hypothetical protein COCOBI_15-0950 [Coccomyxa sp. Obi]
MTSKAAFAMATVGVLAVLACTASCAATDHELTLNRESQPAVFRAVDRAFGRNLLGLFCNPATSCSDPFVPYCCETDANSDGSSCIATGGEGGNCPTNYPYGACCINS